MPQVTRKSIVQQLILLVQQATLMVHMDAAIPGQPAMGQHYSVRYKTSATDALLLETHRFSRQCAALYVWEVHLNLYDVHLLPSMTWCLTVRCQCSESGKLELFKEQYLKQNIFGEFIVNDFEVIILFACDWIHLILCWCTPRSFNNLT